MPCPQVFEQFVIVLLNLSLSFRGPIQDFVKHKLFILVQLGFKFAAIYKIQMTFPLAFRIKKFCPALTRDRRIQIAAAC